jgi:hypothetical protein
MWAWVDQCFLILHFGFKVHREASMAFLAFHFLVAFDHVVGAGFIVK